MTYIEALPVEQRVAEMRRLYRNVFRTPEGRIVFTDLLQTLFVFETPKTQEEQALRNFGTALMSQVLSQDTPSLVEAMLDARLEGDA